MKFRDIYIVRSRSAPVVIPETFAPKVGFSSYCFSGMNLYF